MSVCRAPRGLRAPDAPALAVEMTQCGDWLVGRGGAGRCPGARTNREQPLRPLSLLHADGTCLWFWRCRRLGLGRTVSDAHNGWLPARACTERDRRHSRGTIWAPTHRLVLAAKRSQASGSSFNERIEPRSLSANSRRNAQLDRDSTGGRSPSG